MPDIGKVITTKDRSNCKTVFLERKPKDRYYKQPLERFFSRYKTGWRNTKNHLKKNNLALPIKNTGRII
jgi:hypothetical protein